MPHDARGRLADQQGGARKGDWSVKRPDTEPSGWAFEFANEFIRISTTPPWCCWRCSMPRRQSRGPGGRRAPRHQLAAGHAIGRRRLAAFDVDNDWPFSTRCPLRTTTPCSTPPARTSPARTGIALPAADERATTPCAAAWLTCWGRRKRRKLVRRWGVNYIYGSFLAMRGLAASGAPEARDAIGKAAQWLRTIENADGGWGESCASYDREVSPVRRAPSQTAWPFWACWPCDCEGTPSGAASSSSRPPEADGTCRGSHHGTGFPTSSTSPTACIEITSRCWRWRRRRRRAYYATRTSSIHELAGAVHAQFAAVPRRLAPPKGRPGRSHIP